MVDIPTITRRPRSSGSLTEGRLTLTSGTPVTTTDVTGATNVYFAPYTGNEISLLSGTRWVSRTFTEKTLAVVNSVWRIVNVYGYDSGGTLALEGDPWDSGGQTTGTITGCTAAAPAVITDVAHGLSNGDLVGVKSIGGISNINDYVWVVANKTADTFELAGSSSTGTYTTGGTWYKIPAAPTTDMVLNGTNAAGVRTKSGDPTRKYLGTYMTGPTSGQVADSQEFRGLWNYWNRNHRLLSKYVSDAHSYTTAAARIYNNRPDARYEFVNPLAMGSFVNVLWAEAYGGAGYVLWASNTTALSGNSIRSSATVNAGSTGGKVNPVRGYNFGVCVEYGAASFEVGQIQSFGEIIG